MNKTAFCMVILGANMILSILAACIVVLLWIFGALTWFFPVVFVAYAFLLNLVGFFIEKKVDKQ